MEVKSSSRLRRWSVRILRSGLLIYLITCIVVFGIQRSLIFPGKASRGTAEAKVYPQRDEQLSMLKTPGGETVAVLFSPALDAVGHPHPQASHRPALLYFYGNGETIAYSLEIVKAFRRLGCNVLTADYVGYGMSSGSPSERGVEETADAAWNFIAQHADIDSNRIIVVGRSLGGAAAIYLASTRPVAGLATFSAFTSMRDMAHQMLPWLPTYWLVRDRFENEQRIATVHCPYFNAHGDQDDLVPFVMASRLLAAAKGPTTRFVVAGGRHNDVYEVEQQSPLPAFAEFIESIAGR